MVPGLAQPINLNGGFYQLSAIGTVTVTNAELQSLSEYYTSKMIHIGDQIEHVNKHVHAYKG